MNTRTFSIIKAMNCNLDSSDYGFAFIDDLNYFYSADSDISIPIGDSHIVYTYSKDIEYIGYYPDYTLRVEGDLVYVWKLE